MKYMLAYESYISLAFLTTSIYYAIYISNINYKLLTYHYELLINFFHITFFTSQLNSKFDC